MRQAIHLTLLMMSTALLAISGPRFTRAEDVTATTETARIDQEEPPLTQEEAPDDTAPDSLDYDSFAIVIERNIFDPNRSPSRPYSSYEEEEREREHSTPEDTVNLLGTVITPDWAVAIFKGSSGEYNRTCRRGDSIAGLHIDHIGTEAVILEADEDSTMTLPVGAHLRRRGDEAWAVSNEPMTRMADFDRPDDASPLMGNDQPASEETPTPPSNGGADDILKRMMERRQQEMNQ